MPASPEMNEQKQDADAAAGLETLKARVERVVYHRPGEFAVYKVKTSSKTIRSLVSRSETDLAPGDRIKARGQWEHHPKFGNQFNATVVLHDVPQSVNGAYNFLRKRHVPGVAEGRAAHLMEVFGNDLVEALKDRDRLVNEGGLPSDIADRCTERFGENEDRIQLTLLLHASNISQNVVQRAISYIAEHHDNDVMLAVERNPWVLAEVPGIGFETADQIATSRFTIDPKSKDRLYAALDHVFARYVEGQGHCAITEYGLLQRMRKLLRDMSRDDIEPVLDDLQNDRHPRLIYDDELDLYYRRITYNREHRLGENLAAMAEKETEIDPDVCREAIAEMKGEGSIPDLDDTQVEAVVTALTRRSGIITGGPGTGKSTIQDIVIKIAERYGNQVLPIAPTGRAAKRLHETTGRDAKTAHRALGIDPVTWRFMKNENDPLETDWVICDETSMMDLGTTDGVVRALPAGAKLTIVGDVDQLPSVGPGQVLADMIASNTIPVNRLETVHRTSEQSGIPNVAECIRNGRDPRTDSPNLKGFGIRNRTGGDAIADEIVKTAAEELPSYGIAPRDQVQVLSPMHDGPAGVSRLNERLKEALNPISNDPNHTQHLNGRPFSVGDRVLHNENNYTKEVKNGEIGAVCAVGTAPNEDQVDLPYIEVDFGDRTVRYDTSDIGQLDQAWCVTIHKSQGCEYKFVLMALGDEHKFMLERPLVYTGLTRAEVGCLIVGTEGAFQSALRTVDKSKRVTALDKRIAKTTPEPAPDKPARNEPVQAPVPELVGALP